MQVDFDPAQISFKEIVNLFWASHNPIGRKANSQYKSAIWFAGNKQLDVIQETIEPLVARLEQDLTTDVLPLETFYLAEEYHQKYCLQRHSKLMATFKAMYPRFQEFVDSTSAARLNGFSAGRGKPALFESEKETYGHDLSEMKSAFRW